MREAPDLVVRGFSAFSAFSAVRVAVVPVRPAQQLGEGAGVGLAATARAFAASFGSASFV